MNKNIKIAIIGAGSAGLSAAFFLRKKGYKNIEIFERDSNPGGKCHSIDYEGRSYELGAVIGSGNYSTVEEIMEYYSLEKSRAPGHGFYDFKREGMELLIKKEDRVRLLWEQYFKYRIMLNTKYRRILKPGLNNLPKELNNTMEQWAKEKNLKLLARSFTPLTPAYGYGYFDETPALYYIKYIKWPQYLNLFRKSEKFTWKNGIQSLWRRVAADFHVKYDIEIIKIHREREIIIETDKGTERYDKLIIACPLEETNRFIDRPVWEKNIINRIKYIDYRVFLCKVEGLPHNIGYMLPNVHSSKRGMPMVWYSRYEDRDVYNFYAIGDKHITDEDIIENIRICTEKCGGRFIENIHIKKWRYFPHFDTKDLNLGAYESLESNQGKYNTYITGEIMNFSSVEYVSRYSKDLVERFF